MKHKKEITNITFSAIFLALAFVLPFLTGQIPEVGSMLCPMHIPVLLCGFICGWKYGLIVGLLSPLLRTFILGMPPFFPTALCMSFELATYGLIAGITYQVLAKRKINIYTSLLISMIIGRLIWGLSMLLCLGFDTNKFTLITFFSTAFVNAFLGIIIQIVLIPIIVMTYNKLNQNRE